MVAKTRLRVRVGDFVIGPEERRAIEEVLDSGKISEGIQTRTFEKDWAHYVGTKTSVATNSGTSALIAGLLSLHHIGDGIKAGSKIITTPLTYAATSNSIILTGHEPLYVDVDPTTFGITPDNIKAELERSGEEVSTLLPVHLMGYPCDMDPIMKMAGEYGAFVFEDSAQAHGTKYGDRKTGSMGKLAAFSFYIAHNIQAGELGAITTNDEALARIIRKLKANGRMCDCPRCTRAESGCVKQRSEDDPDPRFTHELIGYNFKTMEFPTALANVQLNVADKILRKRQENVKYLNDALSGLSGTIRLPQYSDKVSYLAYPFVIEDTDRFKRNRIQKQLENRGVETRPLFGCIPTQQPSYAKYRKKYMGRLPNAEHIGANGLYISCHQYLEQEDLDFAARAVNEVFK